jgi:fatty acid/phospholipid biosynthesis enzyme
MLAEADKGIGRSMGGLRMRSQLLRVAIGLVAGMVVGTVILGARGLVVHDHGRVNAPAVDVTEGRGRAGG